MIQRRSETSNESTHNTDAQQVDWDTDKDRNRDGDRQACRRTDTNKCANSKNTDIQGCSKAKTSSHKNTTDESIPMEFQLCFHLEYAHID